MEPGLESTNFQAKVIPGEVSTFPIHMKQFRMFPARYPGFDTPK